MIMEPFALQSKDLMRQFFVLDLYILLHITSKQPASTSSAGHSTMRPCGDAAVPHTDSSAGQKLKHLNCLFGPHKQRYCMQIWWPEAYDPASAGQWLV